VEVTYPEIYPTTTTTSQQTSKTIDPIQRRETRANGSRDATPNTESQPTVPTAGTNTNDQNSTKALQGTIPCDDQVHSNQYCNALKIMRQKTGKGKPRYLVRWEDPTAPDS